LSLDDRNRELGRERAAAVAKAVMAFETLQTKPRERESEKGKSVLYVDKRLALRAISAGLPWFATWRNVDSVV
jgi:hypothetical protein